MSSRFNTIPTRIYDFLKDYPPFSLLTKLELMEIAAKVIVQYLEANQYIYHQGEMPPKHFYVVRQGAVNIIRKEGELEHLIDVCDEGALFGVRPLFALQPYSTSARTVEETLLYIIQAEDVQHILDNNPKVALFFAQNFASGVRNSFHPDKKGRIFMQQIIPAKPDTQLIETLPVASGKKPVTCAPETHIREAAKTMSYSDISSIIVTDDDGKPLGIVTDGDLRKKVATGQIGLERPVATIMSSPVVTSLPDVTLADLQIQLVRNRVRYICLTEDGTPATPVIGVLSENDLLMIQASSPAVLIREILKSQTAFELRRARDKADELLGKYLNQEVAIAFISTIMSEINDAICVRSIELAEQALREKGPDKPKAGFCWMLIGSAGRREQLMRTDQDSFLIYEDVPDAEQESTKAYFLELAQQVTLLLHQTGFEYCQANMMASNPQWCLSLQEWKDQFSHWINNPGPQELIYVNIFFDFRAVYGKIALGEELVNHIFEQIDQGPVFLNFLARGALENLPPLGFFRNFIVEKNGEHKNEFNIKKRAMRPMVDAARVLILGSKISGVSNTFRRFERLALEDPPNKELYESAADAFELLLRFRTIQGLKNGNSGKYFNPSDLNKMERTLLRNTFSPISELQQVVSIRYRIGMFT